MSEDSTLSKSYLINLERKSIFQQKEVYRVSPNQKHAELLSKKQKKYIYLVTEVYEDLVKGY